MISVCMQLLCLLSTEQASAFTMQVYLSEATLSADGQTDITISAHGWVNTLNSPRVFFEGTGYLPSLTPAGLEDLRQEELDKIKARVCRARFSSEGSSPCLKTQNERASTVLYARCSI